MTDDLDPATRQLVGDLRADSGDVDEHALQRVAARLKLNPARAESRAPRRATRFGGARAGVAAALLVGSALGAGGHALVSQVMQTPKSAEIREIRAPNSAPPAHHFPIAAGSANAMEAAAPASNPQPVLPRLAPTSSVPSLEVELRELEAARLALTSGRASEALTALHRHAQRYPHSMLEQEREAMRIRALVASGRHAEARAAAEAFRNAHPSSLLLSSVERAIAPIP